jgi:hypothetical protein
MASLLDSIGTLGDDPTGILSSIGLSFEDWGKEKDIFADMPEMDQLAPDGAAPAVPAGGDQPLEAGLVEPGARNVAQQWDKAAKQPIPNTNQVAASNQAALDPRRGGSTSRYYTRQLYREIAGSKNSSPEARQSARLGLRFNGAPSAEGLGMGPAPGTAFAEKNRAYGLSSEEAWNRDFPEIPYREGELPRPVVGPSLDGSRWSELFKDTRGNDFGAIKDERFNPATGRMEIAPQKKSTTQSMTEEVLNQSI